MNKASKIYASLISMTMTSTLSIASTLTMASTLAFCPQRADANDYRDDDAKSDKEIIKLWPKKAPVNKELSKFEFSNAKITIHSPSKPNGTAIIICPGGGYGGLVTGPEGHGIASWLNRHNITGVVLEYRLPKGRPYVPLLDAQRAIRLVRSSAKQHKIDISRIGIMGFSAGGHLASTAATHFDYGNQESKSSIEQQSCRPDFAILVYPVISMTLPSTHQGSRRNLLGAKPTVDLLRHFSSERQVSKSTPPIFLAHALDDKPVPPENSRAMHKALKSQNIATKYLELPSGGHGLNGYKGPQWEKWQTESLRWLKTINK